MKKLILLLSLGLIVLFFLAIYIFIPREIRISNVIQTGCTTGNITKILHHREKWNLWWPQPESTFATDSSLAFQEYRYKLITPFTDGAELELALGKEHLITRMLLISLGRDSVTLEWQTAFVSSINPFKRIAQYFQAVNMKNNMEEILKSLKAFADKTENIYGFNIQRTTFTDSILAATRFSTATYPSTDTVYNAIDVLKKKIRSSGAEEHGFPMLNVRSIDSTHYVTMIAICVNRKFEAGGDVFTSIMVPMKDRFLETQVTGGPATVKKAHETIERYMNDHFLSAPAISFEILVTDRSKEADTSKWRTTIFQPSM